MREQHEHSAHDHHEHDQLHPHEGAHDSGHERAHGHEHDPHHTHEHSHVHAHEHTHENGETHTHPHEHTHTHEHSHDHGHEHTHTHGEGKPVEELLALMRYMVDHNAAHTRELENLAQEVRRTGQAAAYDDIMAAVGLFDQGNGALKRALEGMQSTK